MTSLPIFSRAENKSLYWLQMAQQSQMSDEYRRETERMIRQHESGETHDDLAEMRSHVDAAELPRADQNDLVCGYQLQHKSWVDGPSGERWELFFTEGVAEGGSYGCAALPD